MTTDLTKPVQTADGRKARVICTDRVGCNMPVIALITREDGNEVVYSYSLTSMSGFDPGINLINIDTTPKNLRIAREAAAQVWEDQGCSASAKAFRAGVQDGCIEIQAVLKALEMVA